MSISTKQETISVDQINQAGGHTVDGEGLLNNYAIEPQMYEEDGGVTSKIGSDKVTVVDIFDSEAEAKNAILAMEQKGLRSNQISVIAKDYEDSESSISWQKIAVGGGLTKLLQELGINDLAISQFEEAIAEGKFLMIEIGSDREASQVQHVLEKSGHSLQDG
jgi:hypothetical protein